MPVPVGDGEETEANHGDRFYQNGEVGAKLRFRSRRRCGWYVRNDPRLATPLLAEPFTHGEIGVLLRKGQDDLFAFVDAALAGMAADGTLDSLKAKHGLAPATGGD